MSETGDAINIQHFEEMCSRVDGYGAPYDPSNANITLVKLQAKLAASQTAMDGLSAADAVIDAKKTDRVNLYKPLGPLVTQAVNYYGSTGTPANKLADAKFFKRKIDGKRATPAVPDDPSTPEDESKQSISASQRSFTQRVEHLDGLIDLFTNDPNYAPNEAPIKVTALTTFSTSLKAANTAVYDAETAGDNAEMAKELELYHSTTGLCARAALVKQYVKGLFGATSLQYKQISGLRFRAKKLK